MDVSTEYIQMCEKAEEIQADHKWEYGDWLVAEYGIFQIGTASFNYSKDPTVPPVRSELPVATIQSDDNEGSAFTGKLIWLPRQDQLQEMVFNLEYPDNDNDTKLAQMISKFYHFTMCEYRRKFTSMEQLWLAFVMFELYHKKWYNGEWEIEDDRDKRTG